jgi:hypothetical protein
MTPRQLLNAELRGKGIRVGTGTDFGQFIGWSTQAQSLLESLLDDKNPYVSKFIMYANHQLGTEPGVEILTRLRSDVENGYLRTAANIISAEVFGDFLEMAQHLLDEGYKDPAASLTGAVLEDGLRRIARNNDITDASATRHSRPDRGSSGSRAKPSGAKFMILHRTPMPAYHPTAPILAEDERLLWGMKSGSRREG